MADYSSFSTDLPAFVSVYFLHNSQSNLFNNKSHNITPLLKMTSNDFPFLLKEHFSPWLVGLTCSACPLPPSSFYDFISFSFSHLPLLQRSSFSAVPWIHQAHFSLRALAPAVLSIKNTFTPRHSHVTFRCWLKCHLVDRVFSDHAIENGHSPHQPHSFLSPLPYLLFFIVLTSWHYIIICLWSVSSIRIQTPWGQRLDLFCSLL